MNIKPFVMEGPVGKFLQRGILESINDRICFLDDDDLFHPQKLQIILDAFGPEHMYFKNSYKIFFDRIESFKEISSFKADEINSSDLIKRYSHVYDTNLSSIAIRKEIVERFINDLANVKTGPDASNIICSFCG